MPPAYLRPLLLVFVALSCLALWAGCIGGSSGPDDPYDKYMTALCDAVSRMQNSEPDVERLVQDAFDGNAEAMKALGLEDAPEGETTGERVARIRAAEARLTGQLSNFVIELETIQAPLEVRDFHEAQIAYYRDLADRVESPDFDPRAAAPAAPTPSSEVDTRLREAAERVPECSILQPIEG